jgi:TolB protein
MNDDALKESLGDLAESVRHVDLYERSLARSGRIGRRRALAGTGAGLAVLAVTGWGLLGLVPPAPPDRPPAVASSGSGVVATPTSGATKGSTPPARSLADLPGRVFYRSADGRMVRLTPDGRQKPVLDGASEAVAVSGDGERIVYTAGKDLMLAGSPPKSIYHGSLDPEEIPSWSPDGTRLLVPASKPGVLTVATGAFSPLPDALAGIGHRWSGDGTTIIFGTPSCRLKVADSDYRTSRTVPVIGDPESARNPEMTAACRPLSADLTGRRITAPLQSVDGGSGDARTPPDAVIDTDSGQVLPLPVAGTVRAALFGPGGDLLIRTVDGDHGTLSVVAPDGRLIVQAREPAALLNLDPVAYTR